MTTPLMTLTIILFADRILAVTRITVIKRLFAAAVGYETVYFNSSRIAVISTGSTPGATRETGPVS